jgi:hypothetical protein
MLPCCLSIIAFMCSTFRVEASPFGRIRMRGRFDRSAGRTVSTIA